LLPALSAQLFYVVHFLSSVTGGRAVIPEAAGRADDRAAVHKVRTGRTGSEHRTSKGQTSQQNSD
jgi:hypothetical protein